MDVRIEVVAAEAKVLMAAVSVFTKTTFKVAVLASTVTTSVRRSLISFGRTSLSAVAPDHIRIGGTAVA